MKVIRPTLKERKRYILFKVHSDKEVHKDEVVEQCTTACLRFLGELGCAEAGVQFLPETWNMKNQTGIIKTGHKFVDKTKASLALIKEIGEKKATVSTVLTSGSLNKIKENQNGVK
jgi:ribonuclease P/MRP protein subunit POP5